MPDASDDRRELDAAHMTSVSEEADARHQSALLDDIRESRAKAREALVVLKQGRVTSAEDPDYLRAVAALEGFILTIEPMLLDSNFNEVEFYREEVVLGRIQVGERTRQYRGLLNALPFEPIIITTTSEQAGRMGGTETVRVKQPLPTRILSSAFQEANHFLQENGLGLRLEPEEIDVVADPF